MPVEMQRSAPENGSARDNWRSIRDLALQNIPPEGFSRRSRSCPDGQGPLIDGDGSWLLVRCSNLLVSLTDITLSHDIVDHVETDDFLMFEFALDGGARFASADAVLASHAGLNCTVVAPSQMEVARHLQAGQGRIRRVGVCVPMSDLIRDYDLDHDGSAERLRRLFPADSRRAVAVSYPLSREEINASQALLDCRFSGRLREHYLRSKLTELLCLSIDRLCNPYGILAVDRMQRSIDVAADFLEGQSAKRLLSELPRRVGLNRNKFNSGFRERFGVTPGEFAREARLQKARRLILETDRPMLDIAEACEFASQSGLSRAYRARFAVSPREERRRKMMSLP